LTLSKMDASEFPTLTTSRLRALFAVLRRRGIDVEATLRRCNVDESQLLNPLYRLPRQEVLKLLGQLGPFQDIAELGLETADELDAQDLDLLGHLLASAPTLGVALDQAIRYIGIIHDGVELELRREDAHACVFHRISGGRVQLPMVVDFSVAGLVRVLRDITGGAVQLSSVKLARPRPQHPERYRKWFGTAVSFDATSNELRISAAALEQALPKANASLNAVLVRQAIGLLRELPDPNSKPTFVERVRLQLSTGLEKGEVSARGVARGLRMGERTLRRRLGEFGTSYRALLDDVRRERALVLTQDPRLNISQVAHQLGFTGPTSFGRAFRRWTGTMPTEYARRARSR
jgi:AraC-like DNA-binding protein